MKKLLDSHYQLQKEEESTQGINIEPWSFKHPENSKIEFKANLWDFGGHEIQYMTHQFFLTPSALYVLVHDNREQTTNFPYWFKIIHLLGKKGTYHSPIIIVLNDKGRKPLISNFNYDYYKKKYQNTEIMPIPVNLAKANEAYSEMREMIQTSLINLKHVGEKLPKFWGPIRKDLLEYKHFNHITAKKFSEICSRHGLVKEKEQELLSGYLHLLGSIIHFQNDSNLQDFIILNPQWAVEAIYKVMTSKKVEGNSGRFSHEDLNDLWEGYSKTEQFKLLNLMKKKNLEVCYEVEEEEDQYIIPQLLNDFPPDYSWNKRKEAVLKFQFYYDFKPKGILNRLIVRLNKYIDSYNDNDLVWKSGVVLSGVSELSKSKCSVQIIENATSKNDTIDIEVIGNEKEKKFVLRNIREEIEKIHSKWFPNVSYSEKIPCYCEGCSKSESPFLFDYESLVKFETKKEPFIFCHDHQHKVFIRRLLEGIYNEEEINEKKASIFEDIHDEVKKTNTNLINILHSTDFAGHLLFKLLKVSEFQANEIKEFQQAIEQNHIAEADLEKLNKYTLEILQQLQQDIEQKPQLSENENLLSQSTRQLIQYAEVAPDLKSKAKIAIGVPFFNFIKYEVEVDWNLRRYINAIQEDIRRGKKEGWKKAFLNDPMES